jgi:putative FmdB family regulatory protein
MPVYEFRCQDCSKNFSALIGMVAEPGDDKCPHCGSANTAKLVSRFRKGRTEDDRVDEMADQLEFMGEPDSPSEMRRVVKEMGKAMDEDMSEEMEEMFEEDMTAEGGDED